MIDADALKRYVESEFDGVCVYDVDGFQAASDFCDMIDNAPTIDAIPAEWLDKKMLSSPRELSMAAWRVLREWQRETEGEQEEKEK